MANVSYRLYRSAAGAVNGRRVSAGRCGKRWPERGPTVSVSLHVLNQELARRGIEIDAAVKSVFLAGALHQFGWVPAPAAAFDRAGPAGAGEGLPRPGGGGLYTTLLPAGGLPADHGRAGGRPPEGEGHQPQRQRRNWRRAGASSARPPEQSGPRPWARHLRARRARLVGGPRRLPVGVGGAGPGRLPEVGAAAPPGPRRRRARVQAGPGCVRPGEEAAAGLTVVLALGW